MVDGAREIVQQVKVLADVADYPSSGPLFNSSSLTPLVPPQGDLSPLPTKTSLLLPSPCDKHN